MIKLASEPDSAYLGEGVYVAEVQVKSQGAAQGVAAGYRVQVRNSGDQDDTVHLTGGGSDSGYTVQYLDQDGTDITAAVTGPGWNLPLSAGGSRVLTVNVTPSPAPLALNYVVPVRAASLGAPARTDEVRTGTCGIGNVAAVTLSSPADLAGNAGSAVTYPYTVTNTGNAANVFALALAGEWAGTLYADDGAGGGTAGDGILQDGERTVVSGTGSLEPGGTYRFFLRVAVPSAANHGAHSDHLLTVTGTGASVSDKVTTSAIAPALSLVDSVRNISRGGVFTSAAEAAPGDTLEYRLAVTSSGGVPATAVVLRNEIPANTSLVAGTLLVSSAPSGSAGACAAASCGEAAESGGTIIAYLGEGATAGAGGTLPVGKTLYLYFRVQVL